MLPYINIFGRTIGTYGLCSIIGLAVCIIIATIIGKMYKYSFEDILLITLSACGGLIVGSHIMGGISRIDDIIKIISLIGKFPLSTILKALTDCFSAMVFYGGFIGGTIGVIILSKYSKYVQKSHALDLYTVMIPLFHSFGRIGCFLGGCCYGKEWSWGIEFPENPIVSDLSGCVRFPVQLVESGCNLLIFAVLIILFLKKKYIGNLIYVYMLIYPVVRFILEFFRGDVIRGLFFGLSTSQWVSIILFTYSIIHILRIKLKRKNKTMV